MMVLEFSEYSIIEKENLLMKEIINFLQKFGGVVERKKLKQEIRDNSDVIPSEYMDFVNVSAKTGTEYKPSDFQFNFAAKHLEFAEYIKVPTRGMIELTEKGRDVQLATFDPDSMVRSISEQKFAEKSKHKKESLTIPEEIVVDESSHIDGWRNELAQALKNMSPRRFELFSRRIVKSMGVEIDENIGVSYGNDGGLDGFGYIQSGDFRTARVAIQAKRWSGNVQSPEIDKFRGAMDKFNAEFGIFITTSDFSKGAINASRIGTRVITLINGEDIADIVAEKKLYVKEVVTYELEDFYYEEDN